MLYHFAISRKEFINQQGPKCSHDSFFRAETCQEGVAEMMNRCDNVDDTCPYYPIVASKSFVRLSRWCVLAYLHGQGEFNFYQLARAASISLAPFSDACKFQLFFSCKVSHVPCLSCGHSPVSYSIFKSLERLQYSDSRIAAQ